MLRASWRGFLRLSLVSCPIYLSPATTTQTKFYCKHLCGIGAGPSPVLIHTRPLATIWVPRVLHEITYG